MGLSQISFFISSVIYSIFKYRRYVIVSRGILIMLSCVFFFQLKHGLVHQRCICFAIYDMLSVMTSMILISQIALRYVHSFWRSKSTIFINDSSHIGWHEIKHTYVIVNITYQSFTPRFVVLEFTITIEELYNVCIFNLIVASFAGIKFRNHRTNSYRSKNNNQYKLRRCITCCQWACLRFLYWCCDWWVAGWETRPILWRHAGNMPGFYWDLRDCGAIPE